MVPHAAVSSAVGSSGRSLSGICGLGLFREGQMPPSGTSDIKSLKVGRKAAGRRSAESASRRSMALSMTPSARLVKQRTGLYVSTQGRPTTPQMALHGQALGFREAV
jgi:hypothetical protein